MKFSDLCIIHEAREGDIFKGLSSRPTTPNADCGVRKAPSRNMLMSWSNKFHCHCAAVALSQLRLCVPLRQIDFGGSHGEEGEQGCAMLFAVEETEE